MFPGWPCMAVVLAAGDFCISPRKGIFQRGRPQARGPCSAVYDSPLHACGVLGAEKYGVRLWESTCANA